MDVKIAMPLRVYSDWRADQQIYFEGNIERFARSGIVGFFFSRPMSYQA